MGSLYEFEEEFELSMAQSDVFRDELAITYPGLGYAMWAPQPATDEPPVEIGDVGFVWDGNFIRLFNALLPGDHPSHARFGVPENYEPLQLREQDHIDRGTLAPGIFSSYGLPCGGSGSIGTSDTSFSYTKPLGAIMSLPVTSQREDTRLRDDFSKWFIMNFNSFSAFIAPFDREPSEIILVTGHHRTRTWFNIAFNSIECHRLHVASALGPRADWQTLIRNIPELFWGRPTMNLTEDGCVFIRGFRAKQTAKPKPEIDLEQKYTIEYIGASAEHRDPLDLLSEYIAKRAPDCDMVLVHDDDLERILRGLDRTSLETFQPEMLTDYLERLNPGIRVTSDSLPTNEQGPRVAMLS